PSSGRRSRQRSTATRVDALPRDGAAGARAWRREALLPPHGLEDRERRGGELEAEAVGLRERRRDAGARERGRDRRVRREGRDQLQRLGAPRRLREGDAGRG